MSKIIPAVKDSVILKKVRKLIKNGKEDRICFAILTVGNDSSQVFRLTQWVSKMLGNFGYYEDWLIKYYPEVANKHGITTYRHADKLRPGRLAWLDWMIAYCEKEEADAEAARSTRKVADTRSSIGRIVCPNHQ